VALFAIIQHFTFNGKLYWVRELRFGGVPFGPYVDRDHFAGLMELIAPAGLSLLILRGERRELWPMLAMFTLLPIGALFLSASRGGIIGFLCEVGLLLVLAFYERMEARTILAGAIILVLIVGVVGWIGVGRALDRFEQYRGLEVPQNRQKVYQALKEELKNDKARSKILQISEIGLVEMTRKRDRENLGRLLSTLCPHCGGTGRIKSPSTVCFELFRDIDRLRRQTRKLGPLTVNLHPDVADYLLTEEAGNLNTIQEQIGQKLTIRAMTDFHHEQFEIFEY